MHVVAGATQSLPAIRLAGGALRVGVEGELAEVAEGGGRGARVVDHLLLSR